MQTYIASVELQRLHYFPVPMPTSLHQRRLKLNPDRPTNSKIRAKNSSNQLRVKPRTTNLPAVIPRVHIRSVLQQQSHNLSNSQTKRKKWRFHKKSQRKKKDLFKKEQNWDLVVAFGGSEVEGGVEAAEGRVLG